MKANAPEKIFLHPDIGGREFIRPWLNRRVNQESVEYTRTDAFIDKAVEWISNNCYIPHATLEDFRKYMEGE